MPAIASARTSSRNAATVGLREQVARLGELLVDDRTAGLHDEVAHLVRERALAIAIRAQVLAHVRRAGLQALAQVRRRGLVESLRRLVERDGLALLHGGDLGVHPAAGLHADQRQAVALDGLAQRGEGGAVLRGVAAADLLPPALQVAVLEQHRDAAGQRLAQLVELGGETRRRAGLERQQARPVGLVEALRVGAVGRHGQRRREARQHRADGGRAAGADRAADEDVMASGAHGQAQLEGGRGPLLTDGALRSDDLRGGREVEAVGVAGEAQVGRGDHEVGPPARQRPLDGQLGHTDPAASRYGFSCAAVQPGGLRSVRSG